MTKRSRTVLFLIFLFLFILIAPSTILYSQGYRFDFKNKKLTQTGGLFLKAEPKQVEIYINDRLVKKTDFFFGSVLIENLLPKKYKIRVEKKGFQPWKKNLEIKEREVTQIKNIVLFPKNPNFEILTKGVEKIWFSPDEKRIILKECSQEGWALKLYDLEKNIKSHLIKEADIYSKGADLMNLKFSDDQTEIYLDIGMKEQKKEFILKLDKIPPQLTEKEITPIPKNVITFQNFKPNIYYLDNSGQLFKTNSIFTKGDQISKIPFPVQPETEYKLKIFPEYIFLKEGNTLYLFNQNSKSFEKFFEGVISLKISPDFKKLVYFSNWEIWILFLRKHNLSPIPGKENRVFLSRFSEKIGDVFWLNPDYLIFSSGNNLKITEIDPWNRIQTWDMGNFPNPKLYFNQTQKKLYILSEGNLLVSENLLK